MAVHLLLILIIALLYLGIYSTSKVTLNKKEKIFLITCFCLIFILVASREMTRGNDTQSYLNLFKTCSTYKWAALDLKYEKGYLLFNILLSYISSNSRFFMIVMSLIFNLGMLYFIKNNSKNYFLSIIMYICLLFYYNSMTMMKQFMALLIILLSYEQLKKGHTLKYAILVIFASFFHSTAWIAFLLYPCSKFKHTTKYAIIIFILSLIVMINLNNIIPLVASIIGKSDLYLNRIGSKNLSNIIHFLIFLVMYIFSLYETNKNDIKDKSSNFNLNVLFLATMINMISINMNILSRASLYFNIFSIVVIPSLIKDIKNNGNKKVTVIMLNILLVTYSSIIIYFRPEWNSAYNYKTCIFPKEGYVCNKN